MFQLDFLNFGKGNHDLLCRRPFLDLEMHLVSRDARDALANVLRPRDFDHQHKVPIGFAPHQREESDKLGLEEPPVERERPALENLRIWNRGGGPAATVSQPSRRTPNPS